MADDRKGTRGEVSWNGERGASYTRQGRRRSIVSCLHFVLVSYD